MSPLVLVPLVALLASGLTLFSGFGLGTLLLPAFALFFPAELAVAMTAVVHLLNNLFKLALLGRHAAGQVVVRFGVPAIGAALLGALLLLRLAGLAPLASWGAAGRTFEITPLGLTLGLLILLFAAAELRPSRGQLEIGRRWLPVGGLVSGFFGGLSGHQGALRSAFLLRAGLSKETFIATGVTISCLVDLMRLGVYGSRMAPALTGETLPVVLVATLAAFMGAFAGARLLGKITLRFVRAVVGVMLAAVGMALALGIV